MFQKTLDLKKIKASALDSAQIFNVFVLYFIGIITALIFLLRSDSLSIHITDVLNEEHCQMIGLIVITANLLTFISLFYAGMNLAGKPVVFLIILFYGFFAALSEAIVYTNNHMIGSIVIIPAFIITSFAQMCAATQSLFISKDLYDCYLKQCEIKTGIRTYLKRYILISIILLFGNLYLFTSSFIIFRFFI